jgi:hypothetical protein
MQQVRGDLERERDAVSQRARITAFALGLGLLPFASSFLEPPVWVIFVLGLAGSGSAGWIMADTPVRAGVLAYAPTAVLVLIAGILLASAAVVLPLVMGLMVSLVASHVGAGFALRHQGRAR